MIHTYLDLTTAHLSRETMDQLSNYEQGCAVGMGWPAMSIAPYEYGAFVTVPPDDEDEDRVAMDALPEDLACVLAHARKIGVYVVRFDADGDFLEDLPTYEW
jgi:hypothetical protein